MKKIVSLVFVLFSLIALLVPASMMPRAAAQSSAGAATAAQPLSERALYTVGTVGSTQLYYTYLVLGLLGDSYAKGVYDKATTLSLVDEIKGLTGAAQQALSKLRGQGDITAEDDKLLADMYDALDALGNQTEGLRSYVEAKDDGTSFQNYRLVAWKKISAILGIEGVDAAK
ncbi:MAG TPA: hypothetical protein VMW87_16220 [Spirochaetia bacterium]|nr:hypothetical protein [Spirochaetia bacterium]